MPGRYELCFKCSYQHQGHWHTAILTTKLARANPTNAKGQVRGHTLIKCNLGGRRVKAKHYCV